MEMGKYVSARTEEHVLQTIKSFEEARRPLRVSASEIADVMGCTSRTVQNAVKRLEEKGRIKISSQKGKPTAYELMD